MSYSKGPRSVAEKTECNQLIEIQCGDSYREVYIVLLEHKRKINASWKQLTQEVAFFLVIQPHATLALNLNVPVSLIMRYFKNWWAI